jgi:hypothetical protein
MAQCLYTTIRHDAPVPCGRCINCRNKRVAGWSARLIKEDKHSEMSFFITLTYDSDHVMFSPCNRPTLWPSHLTSYWKMLRKKFKSNAIKYYACGEYGSNRQRPHYHAILFIKKTSYSAVEILQLIESNWPHGETFTGTVTGESIAYVLKYISKTGSVPAYSGDKRTKEFQRSSKGLGANYLQTNKSWHLEDLQNRAYIPLNGGGRSPIPRYYKDKIYTKEQKQLIGEHMQATTISPDYHRLKELRKINAEKLKI